MAERQLNSVEKHLIYDLDNLGMSREHMCEFFGVSHKTLYAYILQGRNKYGEESYTLEETSQIMTRYLLASLARNMHKLTEEQKLRFLPDLLKVKDGVKEETDLGIKMYAPKKVEVDPEEIIDIED